MKALTLMCALLAGCRHVMVWTLGDVIGVGALALILVLVGVIKLLEWWES